MDQNAQSGASLDPEKFALGEYQAIAISFANGLNAMAILLSLFFVFTGGVLSYVSALFNELARADPTAHTIMIRGHDFRLLQVFIIWAVSVVFTVWSLSFVLAFRAGAGKMFSRASEIEMQFPQITGQAGSKFFTQMHNWYSAFEKGFSPLRLLYFSTVGFYLLIFLSYAAILWFALRF
jgi:hypothetical protein